MANIQPHSALKPALEEGWAPHRATHRGGPWTLTPVPSSQVGGDTARVPGLLQVPIEIQAKRTPCHACELPTGVERH